MKYNEWRDELKSNLLSVSDSERQRVLDYYAEAYADRREAGFSEREIIDEFGAPYDAAQKILNENDGEVPSAKPQDTPVKAEKEESAIPSPPPTPDAPPPKPVKRKSYGWAFVLLCIVFSVPLFILIMSMVGVTVGFCVAPIAAVASGAATVGGSIGAMVSGDVAYGLINLGSGLIETGVGIILIPIFFKLVKLMWKLFKKLFSAIRSAFTGKESAV